MSGRIDISMGFNPSGTTDSFHSKNGYRVYILGHFSGHSSPSPEQRDIIKIDRDHFDVVLAGFSPSVEINTGTFLDFSAVEDFHPDVWLGKVPLIRDLLALKSQLQNPDTASQAAARIQTFLPAQVAGGSTFSTQASESQEDMLQRLLGQKSEVTGVSKDTVQHLLQLSVAPHVRPSADPQHLILIQLVDTVIGQLSRDILHNPKFRKLEALWRATEGLLQEESADQQRIYLLDIDPSGWLTEMHHPDQILRQKLIAHIRQGDGDQAVLLIGDLIFSARTEDEALLSFCAELAKSCGGWFLATVDQTFVHGLPESQFFAADRMMLAYPRYLQRLPYGKKRDPIETFSFEECSGIPKFEELLWGNPAFLVARAFLRASQVEPDTDPLFFEEIPVFSFTQNGEATLQPGSEYVLSEAQAHDLYSKGILPLLAYHQRKGLRLLALRD